MKFAVIHQRRSRRADRERGFTLIEILATLTLLAIVLPVVMKGLSLSLAAAGQARRQTEAMALAQTKLAELVAGDQWQHVNLSGDFGAEWPTYRWAAQASAWEGTTLQELDVMVSWKQQNRQRAVTLSTLVYTGVALE